MTIDERIQRLSYYFSKASEHDYIGESVSQIEHALQAAHFAEQSGHSEEVILASLMHDIGHYGSENEQPTMAGLGVVHHEWIGAYLVYELQCSAKVALLIGHHVNAKRYLAAKKPSYYQRLSIASQGTLTFQGGVMSLDEMQIFEQQPYFKELLQVRVNDEKAKEVDLKVPDLDYYFPRIRQHIESQPFRKQEPCRGITHFNSAWIKQFESDLNTEACVSL